MTGTNEEFEEEFVDIEKDSITSIFASLISEGKLSPSEIADTLESVLFHRYIDTIESPKEALLAYREYSNEVHMDEQMGAISNTFTQDIQTYEADMGYVAPVYKKNSQQDSKKESNQKRRLDEEKIELLTKRSKELHDKNVDLEIEVYRLKQELEEIKNKDKGK